MKNVMYTAEPLRRYRYSGTLERLFDEARYCFVHRKFFEALELMKDAEKICPEKYMSSVILNMSLFHHLLGHKDEAGQLYALLSDTTVKTINYMAFCHRYFSYSTFYGIPVSDSDPLTQIYRHNEMNFSLAVHMYSELHRGQRLRSTNIFDERVLNDYYFKAGLPSSNIFKDKLSAEISEIFADIPHKNLSTTKDRIGIYVMTFSDTKKRHTFMTLWKYCNLLAILFLCISITFSRISWRIFSLKG